MHYRHIETITADIPDDPGMRALPLDARPATEAPAGDATESGYPRLETDGPATCLVNPLN